MPRKPTHLNEDISDTSTDGVRGGALVPSPVETGDVHANRPQDVLNVNPEVVTVPGVGDVSRAAILTALLSKLVGMDGAQLNQVVTAMSTVIDVTGAPTAGTMDNQQAINLQSVSTKEDVAELFSGEDLSEEFKNKAEVIFEAALKVRLAGAEAQMNEKIQQIQEEADARIEEAVSNAASEVEDAVTGVTEELVNQIDKYLTFVAEEYVEKNKIAIEESARSRLAEEVVFKMSEILSRYNVVSENIDPLAQMAAKIEKLESDLQESLDARIADAQALKEFRRKEIVSEASASLTALQRGRLVQLSEGLEFESEDDFRTRVDIIKNSIATKDEVSNKRTLISESVQNDGVPPMSDEGSARSASMDPSVSAVLKFLSGTNN